MNESATGTVTAIELRNSTKRFRTPSGGVYTALRDFDMTVAPAEFCAVVGAPGGGPERGRNQRRNQAVQDWIRRWIHGRGQPPLTLKPSSLLAAMTYWLV